METIKTAISKVQHGMKLEQSLRNISETSQISIYSGELTKLCIGKSIAKIKQAFPTLSNSFYDILAERLKANGFSDDRLEASVNHVIDTCLYPQPTIANFISYDIKVKLYTYQEVVAMAEPHNDIFKTYIGVRIKDYVKPVYAHINDVEKYKLEFWNNNQNK